MSTVAPDCSGGGPYLSAEDFGRVTRLLADCSGIQLAEGKEMLVRSRLAPRLQELGLTDVGEYLARVRADGAELARVIDLLTTNKTGFFREWQHFEFLTREVLPTLDAARPCRVWSAGCATGEEPYSVAMLWQDTARPGTPDPAILATDISTRALARARTGEYTLEQLADVEPARLTRHFSVVDDERRVVREHIRSAVSFARLNLMRPWPMRGPFDLILCRNVMIYFAREIQQRLARRYAGLLRTGGYLLIGHAESLGAMDAPLRFVQPAVYRKTEDPKG